MPRLPLLSHQQFSDQSTVVQQMVGLQFRRCGEFNSKPWHARRPHPSPYKGALLGKQRAIALPVGTLGIWGTPTRALHYLQGNSSDPWGLFTEAEPKVEESLHSPKEGGFLGWQSGHIPGSARGLPVEHSQLLHTRGSYKQTQPVLSKELSKQRDLQHCAERCPGAAEKTS